jgi:hypothetical protein
MGYKRALKTINLELTDRIPNMEYIAHPEFVQKISGINPWKYPTEAFSEAYRILDLDSALWLPLEARNIPSGTVVIEKDRKKAWTRWGIDGSPWTVPFIKFKTIEELLDYDPYAEETRTVEEIAAGKNEEPYLSFSIGSYKKVQKLVEKWTLIPALHYATLFQYFILNIGWELTVKLAYQYPKECKRLIESFVKLSIKWMEAWASLNPPVFISHDDIASYKGLFFPPEWYKKNIFPWYPKIWEPIKKKGIKVLFISDGKYDSVIDDIAKAGADGFIIDRTNDLKDIADRYGDTKVIVGNIDNYKLIHGTTKDVISEVKRCVSEAGDCPGYFFKVPEDISHDIPISNVEIYFEACKKYGKRNL